MLISAASSLAFDGQRKGFILGGGIGFGMASYTQTVNDETSDRENKGAVITDFKIGFAANEQTEIYYTSKVSWFSLKNVFDETVTIANGIGAVGVSYSLKTYAPTWFLTGGLGLSSWDAPFESNSDAWIGFGLFAGAGYEFSKHYGVEFDILYGKPSTSVGGNDASTNALAVKATINALAY